MSEPAQLDGSAPSPREAGSSGDRLVEVAPIGVPLGSLTYRVPADVETIPEPGTRVLVPIGRRRVPGVVLGPAVPVPGIAMRDLAGGAESEPPVPADVLRLACWAAAYYLAPIGEALRLALPPRSAADAAPRFAITPSGRALLETVRRGGRQQAVLAALARGPSLTRRGLSRGVEGALDDLLRGLEASGAIERVVARERPEHRARRRYRAASPRTEVECATLLRRAPRLAKAWARVVELGTVEAVDVSDLGSGAAAALERLVARGWLIREEYRPGAGPGHHLELSGTGIVARTSDQEAALAAIRETRAEGAQARPIVLLGVTGSGKTEVYLGAVAEVLALGGSALVLVPEIALTPLVLGRFRKRFGDLVGVLHSGLRDAERAVEWERARGGVSRVVIGTRLAVFAPIPRLALVVIDEEHDASYKQESGIRYHARDLAVVRAGIVGCPVVLGSATPSLESYWNALSGRYRLVELPGRPGGATLPSIEVVDSRRAEERVASSTRLTRSLIRALEATQARGEQALLFLNRRGWAPLLVCESCGERPGCPRCSVSLVLHRRPPRLVCHYCGGEHALAERCAKCGASEVRRLGAGTQRVEDELAVLLPDLRVARLDRDAVLDAGRRTAMLREVAAGAVDVLIGTQMVAKGHDFPDVTLAAVLSIDGLLARSDFRALERAFQLLIQVSGRSGRAAPGGRVLLQSFHPDHAVFEFARRHDVKGFLDQELTFRRETRYPPFTRLVAVSIEGKSERAVDHDAEWASQTLRDHAERSRERVEVLGPAPAAVERVEDRTRRRILLRAERARVVQSVVAAALGSPPRVAAPSGSHLVVDVDPLTVL